MLSRSARGEEEEEEEEEEGLFKADAVNEDEEECLLAVTKKSHKEGRQNEDNT